MNYGHMFVKSWLDDWQNNGTKDYIVPNESSIPTWIQLKKEAKDNLVD